MTDLPLTEQQRNYLLCFKDEHHGRTIIELSRHFNCSRPNAKKMLDRMVKAGILYKQKNDYYVTEIGMSIKEKLERESQLLSVTIQGIFGIEEDRAANFSSQLIGRGGDCIACFLSQKSKLFEHLPDPGEKVGGNFLLEILDKKTYPVHLRIFQQHVDEADSAIRPSMANRVFENKAELVIDDSPHVVFTTRPLKKEHKGYMKHGSVKELVYQRDGKSHAIPFKDRRAEIPLDVFGQWTYLGGGVLVSYTWFRSHAAINFSGHRAEANYLLVLNLAQC